MTEDKQKIEEIKGKRDTFRSRFDVLKKAKDSLFKLFRQKLEEKKVEEIKQNISDLH